MNTRGTPDIPDGWFIGQEVAHGPALDECIAHYLSILPPPYLARLEAMNDACVATPTFRQRTDLPLETCMIAAGETEYAHLPRALAQYTSIRPLRGRFRVIVNTEAGAGGDGLDKTISVLDQFQATHPEIPLAYTCTDRNRWDTQGSLRRYAGDLAILQSLGSPWRDKLIINDDADGIASHPKLHERMERTFFEPGRITTTVLSEVRHASSGQVFGENLFPNMDAVNAWYDFIVKARGLYYDLGNGVSMRAYMAAEGYAPTAATKETIGLIGRIHQGELVHHPGIRFATGALIYTSPRRAYYKLSQGIGPAEYWKDTKNRFGDPVYALADQSTLSDISPGARDAHINKILGQSGIIGDMADRLAARGTAKDARTATRLAYRSLYVAQAILRAPAPTKHGILGRIPDKQ